MLIVTRSNSVLMSKIIFKDFSKKIIYCSFIAEKISKLL